MNYFVFILSAFLVICGLHKAYGCKHHNLIYSTSSKPGEFEICYRYKLDLYNPKLICSYQEKKYKEGDTIVDGCNVCYCTKQGKMICVTLCQGENLKAVMKLEKGDEPPTASKYCVTFVQKVMCTSLKIEARCQYSDQIVSEGIYFGKYGIFACSEKGKATHLATYPSILCKSKPTTTCIHNDQIYLPGPINEDCECKDDGNVVCEEPKMPKETKTKIMCNFNGEKVPIGPIGKTDCVCNKNGAVSCVKPSRCIEPRFFSCVYNGTMYPMGPIPGTRCNCTRFLSVECEPEIQNDSVSDILCEYEDQWYTPGPIPNSVCTCTSAGTVECGKDAKEGCFYIGDFVPVGQIAGTNCTCKNDSMVECAETTEKLPTPPDNSNEVVTCSYDGKQHKVGPIPETTCTCKPDGNILCKTSEAVMLDFPSERICSYEGIEYPVGPIPDTACVCQENGSVSCENKPTEEIEGPDDCLFEDKFYGVGPIPDSKCNCTKSGYVECKGGCNYNGKLVPFGPIEGEECLCEKKTGKDMGEVYCKKS